MRKVLLISSRPLEHSGMTNVELNVISYNKDIIDFEVACGFDYISEYIEVLDNMRITHIRLPDKSNVIKYMEAIRKVVKKGKYEAVYIHGNSAMMIMEALPSKLGGAYVVTHCHNTSTLHPLAHYLSKPLFNMLVDVKIGCSEGAAKWAYCGKRQQVVLNGINTSKFKYDPIKREKMRSILSLRNNTVIGHIGTFNYQKNHEKLVSVFDVIHKRNNSAKLLLIGDGENQNSIKNLIASKGLSEAVIIIDHVDNPQDYLQAMDIMVLPSRFEGFCLVAIEAQCSGLPVLASDSSREAIVTKESKVLSIKERDSVWADEVINMMTYEREDKSQALEKQGLGYVSMMEKIRTLLS